MQEHFLNQLKNTDNFTYTENGAGAFQSTFNACLDAFGSLAAMKNSTDEAILDIFKKAFAEDRATAMRLLFYIRDIRGGQGMRRIFRIILVWLANNYPELVRKNFENILFFGRGDDYLCLLDTDMADEVCAFMLIQLVEDMAARKAGKPCSLLVKWLPSENASSEKTKAYARQIIKAWGWPVSQYRHTLSNLRQYINVTEVKMSAREWTDIQYEEVPAKASINYANAFYNHDKEGYTDYILKVANGNAKINAKSLFPVDIIHKVLDCRYKCAPKDRILYDAMWKALPNYWEGTEETGICMVDTSGSMSGTPMEVAISLGVYCADKCHGPFKNHYITFSEKPTLVELRGEDIVEKVSNMPTINPYNTNIEAAFDLILRTAIENHLPQSDLPSKLYIISDMQFDEARGADTVWARWKNITPKPFMQQMKGRYANAGYVMPSIVYWNVRTSEYGMFQQTFEGEDCAMVSGYSASLFKSIIDGTTYEEEVVIHEDGTTEKVVRAKINPMEVMMKTLYKERYDRVFVG